MLYTGRGDAGTTVTCREGGRVTKGSHAVEALGGADEVNSWLGVCKASLPPELRSFRRIIHNLQEDLFIIQAELAGADKYVRADRVKELGRLTEKIQMELPEINTFFVAGETEASARLDFARALARRAERQIVRAADAGEIKIEADTRAYLNRLSSVLYALARLANHKLKAQEQPPAY